MSTRQAAGAIIRVSTSKQLEGTSPEKQLEGVRSLAAAHGFDVADAHAWTLAESGNLRDRAGFRGALEAVAAGEVSRVYVYSIDRLGRNLLELLLFLRELEDQEIECWEAERVRRLAWDDFMVQVEGAVASKERQEIRKRTQDGLLRTIRSGQYSGGIVAYGYKLNAETKRLEIDEDEAAVVRLIFEWAVEERLSTTAIAHRLNGLGIPTRYAKLEATRRERGKRSSAKTAGIWRAGRVRNMLRNPAYAGAWEWGKRSATRRPEERIAGSCPAIVSAATQEGAARVLAANRWVPGRPARRQYLLRGLMRCSDCGRMYVGSVSHVAAGEKRYYRCGAANQWHKLGTAKCPSRSLPADEIERIVWHDLRQFIKRPEVAIEQLRAARAPVDTTLGERLAEVEGQIRDHRRRERNLLRVAAESRQVDPQALDDVLAEIRASLASLEAYRGQLQARLDAGEALEQELFSVARRLATLRGRIDRASFAHKRRAVEELVKGITVATRIADGRKTPVVSITYRFEGPDSASPDAAGLFSAVGDCTLTGSSPPPA